jgi:predicted 3-demethylubiquinone-9 3-methyltransferase (glyoxalase superfamily)
MNKITPCLGFNDNLEEVIEFYRSVFKNSKVTVMQSVLDDGSVKVAMFELEGQNFIAIEGGPQFQFTEAVSMSVDCGSQDEVDYYWEKLSEGGQEVQCGWVRDKFGLSWQVVPTVMHEMLVDQNRAKAQAAFNAMLTMTKMNVAELQRAFDAA